MKNIAYRAWHKKDKYMMEVDEILWQSTGVKWIKSGPSMIDIDSIELLFRLPYKSGKNEVVFEGDVLEGIENKLVRLEVTWDGTGFMLLPVDKSIQNTHMHPTMEALLNYQVIGNIYQNDIL